MKCGPLCSSFFQYDSMPSTVSVGIWIPNSASTPQVGFLSLTISSTWEEILKFQGRRRSMEVLCSGVSLGSLAGF